MQQRSSPPFRTVVLPAAQDGADGGGDDRDGEGRREAAQRIGIRPTLLAFSSTHRRLSPPPHLRFMSSTRIFVAGDHSSLGVCVCTCEERRERRHEKGEQGEQRIEARERASASSENDCSLMMCAVVCSGERMVSGEQREAKSVNRDERSERRAGEERGERGEAKSETVI